MVGKSRLPVALFFYCKNIFDFVILSRFPVVENKIVILRPGLEKESELDWSHFIGANTQLTRRILLGLFRNENTRN